MPCTYFLTNSTKQRFIRNASTASILVDMIQEFKHFDSEMNDNLALYRRSALVYKLTSDDAFYYIKYILWTLGLALNIVLIVVYRRDSESEYFVDSGETIMQVIAIVIATLAGVMAIAWFYSRYKQKVSIASRQLRDEELKIGHRKNRFVRWLRVYIYSSILAQAYPVLFCIHLASSLLGIFFEPFFYTIQLLLLASLSDTTNYVVQAITTHYDQLILTFILAVVVMYCYSVLTANYFWDTMENNQTGAGPIVCNQLWECLLYVVDTGLRNGGGLADKSTEVDPDVEPGRYVAKFLFDVVFFMLINVIALNIIFGIIIDTFAAMREANDARGRMHLT